MARTVSVTLRAYVAQFRKAVGEAEKATEDLGDAIDDVDGKGFDEAAAAAKGLGDTVGKTSRKAGRDVDEMSRHVDRLDGQIRQAEAGVRDLAKAFVATGDPKIVAQLRAQQRELTALTKTRKMLADGDSKGGLADSIRSNLQKVSPVAAGVGAFGASMTPLLSAIIASAVVGGVGVGGIVGGIALAARSPAVKDRAQKLGESVLGGLTVQARDAFSQPLLESMDELERVAARTIPRIGQIFDDLAPSLLPLTRDLGRSADGLLAGVQDVAANSGPVLAELGKLLADLGESVGGLLSSLADHPEAAAWAVEHLNDTVTALLSTVGAGMSVLLTVGDAIAAIKETTGGWADGNAVVAGTLKTLKSALLGPVDLISDMYEAWKAMTPEGQKAAEVARANAVAAEILADKEAKLKEAQDAAAAAQQDLTAAMGALNPAGARAQQVVDGLKKAIDSLYGAQMRATDANEGYEASWDDLSESVKRNKGTLDIHTAAGRANRDALQGLLTSSRDMYLADIEAGKSTEEATQKHRERTKAVEKEASRLGLNKKITGELIDTYGQIPPKKTTLLVADGVNRVADQLFELSVIQYALAKGIPIQSARALLNGQNKAGPDKRNGGYASGGHFTGRLPGAPSAVDNLTGMGPGGQVFGLAGGEYVVNAAQTQKHLPLLAAINAGADGYAAGGYFPEMDKSRTWPFDVTANRAYVMSEATARSKVVPEGPGGGATAPWIVSVIRANFPGIDIISTFRKGAKTLSGNTSYHARNRAVDTEPSEELARWFYTNYKGRLKELITPWQQYNVHNGKSHTYTGAVWNQHNFAGGNAHDHIAMAAGGVIGEPVFGVGRSGTTYSFGEVGPERVTPMRGYASGGLVNVAGSTSTSAAGGGSRLDYLSSLIAAREAVVSLSAALKENGKSFSLATAKGRDNRRALIAGVQAAQSAAEAKYAETGSIKAANKVYDDYIKQLDRSLKAMGVNAKQRKALLKTYGERPTYDTGAAKQPSNSSYTVRRITDQMAAEEALASARQQFAWTKPSFNIKTEAGRAELQQLFGFLSAAQQAAQSLFDASGDSKQATAFYNEYLNQLRATLSASGMTKQAIDGLFTKYGRITLTKNRWGGMYERASGGLREAQIAAGGPTRYAWAEPETGGEAFIPRRGNRARSTAIWQHVGQNWLGQNMSGRSGLITVMATIPITLGSEVITRQVRLEVDAAVGKVVDAVVYQTA